MKLPALLMALTTLAPNVHCANAACTTYNVDPYVRTHSKYGIGCMGNVPPGQDIPTELPPQSYLISDIDKPGFPKLSATERLTVRHIKRDHPSKTLRLAWVHNSPTDREFIVFDANDGPCEVAAPGYKVLNGSCNEYYEPGENPYYTHPVMGCY